MSSVLLTPREAAAELGICERTLRKARQAGEIPYVNVGMGAKREAPRFERADLLAWIEERKKRQCPSSSGGTRRTASTATTSGYKVVDFQALLKERRAARRSG